MKETNLIKELKQWFISSDLITPEEYNDYIKDAKIETVNDSDFEMIVNSNLAKSLLLNIKKEIENGFSKIVGHSVKVVLMHTDEHKNKVAFDSIKDNNKINSFSKFTFDNYVSGASNKNAIKAAHDIVEKPGTVWNPLFIHGESGLGKTHLLGAIYNSLIAKYPGISVRYMTSVDFRKEVVGSLNAGYEKIEEVKHNLADLQVLLLDDIQFLANSSKTNEIFFNVFNQLIEKNAQIVLTSDKAPEKLNGFDVRLVSRFSQGLKVKLESLDTQIKHEIIKFKASVAKIKLSDSAVSYIASCHANDVRRIEGSINMISFVFLEQGDKVLDYDDIFEILKDSVYAPGSELTAQKIKDVVADKYGVTSTQLEGKSRIQTVANPRHLAMYLISDLLKMNQSEIGSIFGSRDHSTVTHAINKIETNIKADKKFKDLVTKLKKEITS
ncbi:chromosomal replication initiation protein [Spiroplasma clarkii]|uniref:Chromosomal replication initiator protein DnaA n=1 Tax=Spiroplasma clarkii TaxID=2139 RepID=A0A1Y0KYU4_9MOLU|nr:chromosomal replication initiator protein DnaA [Spiroplasma clarkii]ARU90891.1 chromosomal replication initiation protein [Spiroplasma clarkii]ATX70338.1 chromosomal replication initiation protein [Spiroplasma clarkii]